MPPARVGRRELLELGLRGSLAISLFRWSPEDGEAAIDGLEPFHVQRIRSGA